MRMKPTIFPLPAYSLRYIPLITPTGNAKIMLPTHKHNVPTIAGRIPPSIMPSLGMEVRKSHDITPIPLTMMNISIHSKTPIIHVLINPIIQKAAFCLCFFISFWF